MTPETDFCLHFDNNADIKIKCHRPMDIKKIMPQPFTLR